MAGKFNNASYSGTDSYRYVDQMFKSSRRILIVSPYIDDYYAKFISSQSRGKEIYVITSNPQHGAMEILKGARRSASPLALSAIAMLGGFGFLAFAHPLIGTMLLCISVLAFYFLLGNRRDKGNVNLKVPSKFVHAKMYIGEESAIYGSANMTYNGMHKNVEHIERIDDPTQIKELENQFWEIWKSF